MMTTRTNIRRLSSQSTLSVSAICRRHFRPWSAVTVQPSLTSRSIYRGDQSGMGVTATNITRSCYGDHNNVVRIGTESTTITKRTHMNHGNPDMHDAAPSSTQSGPRKPMAIGLEATKHTGNILRLLEASHGSYAFNTVDTLSTVWHPKALCWMYSDGSRAVLEDDNNNNTNNVDEKQQQEQKSLLKWTSLSPIEVLAVQEEERLLQYSSKKTTLMMMPQQVMSAPRLLS
jgi:hypothetical protein